MAAEEERAYCSLIAGSGITGGLGFLLTSSTCRHARQMKTRVFEDALDPGWPRSTVQLRDHLISDPRI
jgi:hypothetical protein